MPTKAKPSKDAIITGRVRKDVYERLDALAEATERSRSFMVAEAIENYVSLQEWQIAGIQEGLRQADAGEFASRKEIDALFKRYKAR